MDLLRTIYSSRPFGFDAAILNGILADARRLNARDDITGALICRADIYLQWLEGPADAVRQALERITRDDRHLEMRVHVLEPVTKRVFGDWAMLDDPVASLIWTQQEVANDAIERATPEEVTGFFLRLRDKMNARDAD